MELRQEGRSQVTRWFLRAQGNTLGPYADKEILAGLRAGDFLSSDRVTCSSEHGWTPLEDHPYFASFGDVLGGSRAEDLAVLPSPRKLRNRSPAALPPIPVELKAIDLPAPAEPEKEDLPAIAPIALLPEAVSPPPQELLLPICPPVEVKAEVSDEADLELAAFELERALELLEKRAVIEEAKPQVREEPAIPQRPELKPVFLHEPSSWSEISRREARVPRVIQIELKLPERPMRKLLAIGLVLGLALSAGYWVSENKNKTRDLKDSRLSDPSSPTTLPLDAGDPVPQLKAPTRPQRE